MAGGQRYWDGEAWTEGMVPAARPVVVAVAEPYRTNHVLHLLLTVLTLGAWAPVWVCIGVWNAYNREQWRRHQTLA